MPERPHRTLEVLEAGPQSSVQDLGRPGHAHLGVPRSGALDAPALRLGNRLVGNPEDAAGIECLLGGLVVRLARATTVAVTGASVMPDVDGRAMAWGSPLSLPAGATVSLGSFRSGLRCYLAVAGAVRTAPVLGSRSSDLLSGIGPPVLGAGDVLALGEPTGPPGLADAVPLPHEPVLRLTLGPRDDCFEAASLAGLDGSAYVVGEESNRIGLRLSGAALRRNDSTELPSEGMVLGAVQVPPDGQPVVFLADHPTTGGYPVIGVVEPADLAVCAQVRPGERVTLRVVWR